MDKLVTVIIPVWNGESRIEGAVRSVLNQSWKNIRLIVADDGSTDGTAAVLRRLADEDARLTFFTSPNAGPAIARNRALARLPEETDYVMFMDGDDLLLPDAVEYALKGADGAELVIFGYAIRRQNGSFSAYREPEQSLTREELGGSLARLYKANLLNQVWGKLYAAPLLSGLSFPDYRWGEDRLFLFQALERAERIRVLPECKYHYIMHEGESLITRYYDKKFRVCCEIDARTEELCRSYGVSDEADFRYMYAKSVFSCLTTLFSRTCTLTRAEKRRCVRCLIRAWAVSPRCGSCAG